MNEGKEIETSLTPMLKQYFEIKSEIEDKDTILFFRLGDFYEMFFEDAMVASKILDITLTSRNKNDPNPVPLCGIPYHAAEGYIARLIESGKKVAICEQVEDPKLAKGVVKREIVRIVTPGVVFESTSLDSKENNYLVAISPLQNSAWALAAADISTGEFRVTELLDARQLADELSKIEPREILIPCSLKEGASFASTQEAFKSSILTVLEDTKFDPDAVAGLEGVNDVSKKFAGALGAAGAIRNYLKYARLGERGSLEQIRPYSVHKYMVVDDVTKRNLELTETIMEGSGFGTLLWLLDNTSTSMGARLLRQWLFYPLMDVEEINLRLDAVEALKGDIETLTRLSNHLKEIHDIERLAGRIVTGSANARDTTALATSLKPLPEINGILASYKGLLKDVFNSIDTCDDIVELIEKTLIEDPPISIKDGGIIRQGVSKELDDLCAISRDGKGYIAGLEGRERQRTGISSLKVRYNKVFGYYIEVTNTHKDKVPEDYIRKQTLSNAERFITPELKEYEDKIIGADERIKALEYEIFSSLRLKVAAEAERLRKTAFWLAVLDCLLSLAIVASKYNYSRPNVTEHTEIKIKGGRHPIIERLNPTERFVPNDLLVNTDRDRLLVITGPNMAGKSTVMRQVALIVLMAQMGSFVPAESAEVGLIDRIFTRVGAHDNLMRGQSTFMVEMVEAANILKYSTKKSLIVIDEIGRGTSTFDGVSIAWAVAEYIHDNLKARTLFATHYHELTDLAATKSGVKNFNIAVREWNNKVIFLRRLVPGGVNRSYGIQVARLAGLPDGILSRAKEILENLEKGELNELGMPNIARSKQEAEGSGGQLNLFHQGLPSEVLEMLTNLDVTAVTPIEAMNLLHDIKLKMGGK